MMRWLRSLFAWRVVRDTGVWRYCVNDVTGRRWIARAGDGYQPRDEGWLKTGEWTERPALPRDGSGIKA